MDLSLLLHIAIEISVTACLFFISWINITSAAHGRYSVILGIGAAVAGFANMIHVGVSIIIPQLETFSTTLLGSTSQFVLLGMFALIGICSKSNHCPNWVLATVVGMPIIGSIVGDWYQLTHGQLLIFQPISVFGFFTIYYPFYLFCAAVWTGISILVSNKRKYIFPPYSSTIFFTYAIAANVMVAFIHPENIEMCNLLSHALKFAGYYTVILLYLISKYQFDVGTPINTKTIHHHQLIGK